MTSTSTDIISSNHLKGNSEQLQPFNEDNWSDKTNQPEFDFNREVDFWHYDRGVNVIPVDSKIKMPLVDSWKPWQDNPITDDQHEDWKKKKRYDNGIAVITGKIWRGPHKDKYLVGIDLDNKKGIYEFIIQCFPDVKTLEHISQKTMVEQHSDNRDKAHVYFIVEKSLTNRSSINGNSKGEDNIPIIEVKAQGKSYVVCSPSIHKDGCRYEIIGTKTFALLDKNQSEQLQDNLNQIYKKYGETGNKNDSGLIPIAELFQDDYVSTIGSRHSNLLRVMDSLIQKHKHNLQWNK